MTMCNHSWDYDETNSRRCRTCNRRETPCPIGFCEGWRELGGSPYCEEHGGAVEERVNCLDCGWEDVGPLRLLEDSECPTCGGRVRPHAEWLTDKAQDLGKH